MANQHVCVMLLTVVNFFVRWRVFVFVFLSYRKNACSAVQSAAKSSRDRRRCRRISSFTRMSGRSRAIIAASDSIRSRTWRSIRTSIQVHHHHTDSKWYSVMLQYSQSYSRVCRRVSQVKSPIDALCAARRSRKAPTSSLTRENIPASSRSRASFAEQPSNARWNFVGIRRRRICSCSLTHNGNLYRTDWTCSTFFSYNATPLPVILRRLLLLAPLLATTWGRNRRKNTFPPTGWRCCRRGQRITVDWAIFNWVYRVEKQNPASLHMIDHHFVILMAVHSFHKGKQCNLLQVFRLHLSLSLPLKWT